MRKREAVAVFRAEVLPHVLAQYGPRDAPARREAWNDFTDALVKEGLVPASAYNWLSPV